MHNVAAAEAMTHFETLATVNGMKKYANWVGACGLVDLKRVREGEGASMRAWKLDE